MAGLLQELVRRCLGGTPGFGEGSLDGGPFGSLGCLGFLTVAYMGKVGWSARMSLYRSGGVSTRPGRSESPSFMDSRGGGIGTEADIFQQINIDLM